MEIPPLTKENRYGPVLWLLGRQFRKRTSQNRFTISMIALTIALLLTVIIMMDSTAPVMANYATIRGAQHSAIFHLNNGPITNPYSAKFAITNQLFNYSDIADKLELNFCQISFCAARIQMTANTSPVIAVNLTGEFSLHFGLQQLESGNVNLSEGLPWNECIISTDFKKQ